MLHCSWNTSLFDDVSDSVFVISFWSCFRILVAFIEIFVHRNSFVIGFHACYMIVKLFFSESMELNYSMMYSSPKKVLYTVILCFKFRRTETFVCIKSFDKKFTAAWTTKNRKFQYTIGTFTFKHSILWVKLQDEIWIFCQQSFLPKWFKIIRSI